MKTTTLSLLGASLFVSLAFGCDAEPTTSPSTSPSARSAQAEPAPAPDTDAGPIAFELGSDWGASVDAGVATLREADPELADALFGLQPRSTRAGTVRLTGPLVRQPIAAAVFLDRLREGNESVATRAALAEALPRTTASFGPAVVDLLAEEDEAEVRLQMVVSLRTADASSAIRGLEAGLQDPDARVRASSAKTAARRVDATALSDALIAAAGDENLEVKTAAVRSLGILRVTEATPLIKAELAATDAEVRLAAVRALTRIDPEGTAALASVRALTADPDARVSKAATAAVAAAAP